MRFFIFAALVFSAMAASVHAQSNISALLEQSGYSSDSYDISLIWEEQSRIGDPQLISAAHIKPRNGDAAFDLYWDAQGKLLDAAALSALGIQPKDWSGKTVNKSAETVFGFPKFQNDRPTPLSFSSAIAPEEYLLLPTPQLKSDDTTSPEKAPLKIGDFTALPQSILVQGMNATDGAWSESPDGGLLWNLTFRSPGVTGQRIHFNILTLPPGAQMLVFNADKPAEVYGPLNSAENYLAPSCFGEGTTVELFVPADADISHVNFEIDQVLHITKAFEQAVTKAGFCNNDVNCFAEWSNTALGVGLIEFGGGICTCSLIADDAPDTRTPYILTANHCINKQSTADMVEVYWLYQTDICDGLVPNLADVPRNSGGANYLVGSSSTNGTDVSLLLLNGFAPAGIPFLGFSTEPQAIGADIVAIHHPQGEYKRISFGDITNVGSPAEGGGHLLPLSRYHETLWHDGATEPGSSGGPLFIPGTQQIIGQLYGGRSSCSALVEPDYYGRFDVSYPLLDQYLGEIPGVEPPPALDIARAETLKSSFAAHDANGDGNLSLAELATEVSAADFNILDTNGNALVSLDEIEFYITGDEDTGCNCFGGAKNLDPIASFWKHLGDILVLAVSMLVLKKIKPGFKI